MRSTVVVLSVLLVSTTFGQLSTNRDQECKENETFTTCGSACEPSCDNPNPSFCTLQCVVGCQCDKGFFRNSEKKCVKTCSSVPATAPPLPAVNASMTCGANEEFNTCHNPCSEKKCPTGDEALVNCLMMCMEGCSCKSGFVRNTKGVCVKEAACPPVAAVEPNPCALVDCRSGMICEIQEGNPVCVPSEPKSITCANVRCGTKGGCAMVVPAGCQGFRCKKQPQCVDENPCHFTKCSAGQDCTLVQVTCIKAPCKPIAECRPRPQILPISVGPTRVPRQEPATPSGCMTMRCGTPAGCADVLPSYCGDDGNCPTRGMCIHENACAATSCLVGSKCVLQEVTCIRAPCNPIAKCIAPPKTDTRCPRPNERYINCKTSCSDVQCNKEPMMCAQVCRTGGCVCNDGFFRDKSGSCVTQNECDAQDISNGTSSNGNSTFVNETLGATCATMRCSADTECVENEIACLKAPCSTNPKCIPRSRSNTTLSDPSEGCAAITCPVGEKCEETEVQCFAAPCPKAVTCVPMDSTKNSTARGGCDVVRCMSDETCEEQTVNCVMAPCPIQVVCVKVTHHNSTEIPIPPPTSHNSTNGNGCGNNQTMSDCLNTCSEPKCPGTESSMMCTKHCGKGCACQNGFLRSSDGQCYKEKDCPPDQVCGQNEEYRCATCGSTTCKNPDPDCEQNKKCKKACVCAVGFVKRNRKCVSMDKCPDHNHGNVTCSGTEEYTDCLPQCTQLCSGVQQCTTGMTTSQCQPGCVCRRNYKYDSDGKCVHNRHCFKTTTCDTNEEWTKCMGVEATCGGDSVTTKLPQRDQCFSGCTCSSGFVRSDNGTCIEKAKC